MAIKSTVKSMLKSSKKSRQNELWPMIDQLYQEGITARLPYEQRWLINLSFLAGKQYVFYNQTAQQLQAIRVPKGRLRVVDNKIMPRYAKQVSRMIRTRPRVSVIPASNAEEDIKAARLGDKVLKNFQRNAQMTKKKRKLASWIYATGNAFIGDRWDANAGPVQLDADGKAVYAGDVALDVYSPFEIIVPELGLGDVEINDLPWIGKIRYRNLYYFQKYYKKTVSAEARPIPFAWTSSALGLGFAQASSKEDGAIEKEIYMKPNSDYPNGLHIIGANGQVLLKEDYPFDEYHLEQFKDFEVPGVFWGMATTEAAIWLQKIHNRTLSDIAEFNRSMARGKWLIPRKSKMETKMDDSMGQHIYYNPVMGAKPEMLTLKGLPATYTLALEIVANGLMELYNQHEVTQGTNKSDIRSGEMVQLLLEQDDHGNAPTHAIFEESYEAVMKRVLRRIKKGYTNERIIAIDKENGEYDLVSFKGADLKNSSDVLVTKESSIPESKVTRQARIRENYRDGLYGNPQDERTRERVLQMLEEVPEGYQDIFKESHQDRQVAKKENMILLSGKLKDFPVNSYDNHQIHLVEHNKARKEGDYQKLKIMNPRVFAQLEAVFINHVSQHQRFLAEQMKAQMKQLAAQQKLGGK